MRFKLKVKERVPNILFGVFFGITLVYFMNLYQWKSCQETKNPDRIQNRNLKDFDSKSEEGSSSKLKNENHQIPDPLQEISSPIFSAQIQPVQKMRLDNVWRAIKEVNEYDYKLWQNNQANPKIISATPWKTIGSENNILITENSTVWDKFQLGVSNLAIYESHEEAQNMIRELLDSLASSPFESISQFDGGTQFKLFINLQDGGEAMFKPMRFPRSQGTLPNHYQWNDFERHTAEIAAFHLDRLLVSCYL